jgi:hypothetical protein
MQSRHLTADTSLLNARLRLLKIKIAHLEAQLAAIEAALGRLKSNGADGNGVQNSPPVLGRGNGGRRFPLGRGDPGK